jgi:hypothetical protein
VTGLDVQLLASGRLLASRTGRGYSREAIARAIELRSEGPSLVATAEQLRDEFDETSHITKDTLASLLRRQSERRAIDELPDGLDRRTVNCIHTILHRALKGAIRWGRLACKPGRRRRPTPRWPEVRRRSSVGRRDAAHVPR